MTDTLLMHDSSLVLKTQKSIYSSSLNCSVEITPSFEPTTGVGDLTSGSNNGVDRTMIKYSAGTYGEGFNNATGLGFKDVVRNQGHQVAYWFLCEGVCAT